MITAFMTWCGVVALVSAAVTGRFIAAVLNRSKGRKKIVSLSNEREMLFVPGDTAVGNDNDYEDYD